MKRSIEQLARPEIIGLQAYESARSLTPIADSAIYLDANEGSGALARYPDPQPPQLLAAAAAVFGTREESILMVRGVDEAIDLLMRAFCRPGVDSILITPPTYAMYEISARIQGAGVLEATQQASGGGFSVPTQDLLETCKASGESLKLVFLCSPNNPTGSSLEADQLAEICAEVEGQALVILDEAYVEFSSSPSLVERIEEFSNLVVLRTLSKAWGSAGARFGMAFAQPAIIRLLQKIRAPYPLSTPTIEAVAPLLTPANVERMRNRANDTRTRREQFARDLAALPIVAHVFPSDANFLLLRATDLRLFLQRCADCNVVVRDRSRVPGLEGCIRVSIGDDKSLATLLAGLAGEVPVR